MCRQFGSLRVPIATLKPAVASGGGPVTVCDLAHRPFDDCWERRAGGDQLLMSFARKILSLAGLAACLVAVIPHWVDSQASNSAANRWNESRANTSRSHFISTTGETQDLWMSAVVGGLDRTVGERRRAECSTRADCPIGMSCLLSETAGARCVRSAQEGQACSQDGQGKPTCLPSLACEQIGDSGSRNAACYRPCDVAADCRAAECCGVHFVCEEASQCSRSAEASAAERIGPSAYSDFGSLPSN